MDADRWQRKKERFERRMDRLGERFGRRMDRWDGRWERKQYGCHSPRRHLFAGLVFVTIGVLFLLGNMGFVNVNYVLRFWPVILVAAGMFKLVESGDNYRQSSGIFWIVVGGLFLLGSFGILRVAPYDFWPVVLIGLGVLMLWRYALPKREPPNLSSNAGTSRNFTNTDPGAPKAESGGSAATSSNSILSAMAILGSVERRNNSQDFRGGSATAVMGRCEIDLRAAAITSPHEPVLEVFAMWGGIEIRVPPDWTVVSHVDPIMGGYEDATQPPKEESKRILIRGAVIMGGIEVTN